MDETYPICTSISFEYTDPNKTVHWILKQPLIHFHYPKAIHEDRIKEVMSQCKLESQLLGKK